MFFWPDFFFCPCLPIITIITPDKTLGPCQSYVYIKNGHLFMTIIYYLIKLIIIKKKNTELILMINNILYKGL